MTTTKVVPDEPLICPVSASAALCRLSEVIGACERLNALPDTKNELITTRETLNATLESGDKEAVNATLPVAQNALIAAYEAASAATNAEALCLAAGFPPPGQVSPRERFLQGVDLSTLQFTFARFGKQVMVSFAFRDAPGAIAYWLREVRYIDGERTEWARLEDQIVESRAPLFSRVRLPSGIHHFRIEARNPAASIVSDEFTIEVPTF